MLYLLREPACYLRELTGGADWKAFVFSLKRTNYYKIYLFRLLDLFSDSRPEFKLRPEVVDLYFKKQKG